MGKLKNGIGHILSERSTVPVIPVFFHGLGKSLPKGEFVLVPFSLMHSSALPVWQGNRREFMAELNQKMLALQAEAVRPVDKVTAI